MLLNTELEVLVLLIPALVFSLCVHEFSHGYIAYKLGDNTAAYAGRLTLNPLSHLDPIGTLMLLLIGFGYAKPVPVNISNLNDPKRDMIRVAFAGPASNFMLCLLGCLLIRSIGIENLIEYNNFNSLGLGLYLFSSINMILGVFNMIPIYPLDGGQIFGAFISEKYPNFNWKLQKYGPNALFGIIFFGIITGYSIIGLIMYPFRMLVLILAGLS